MSDVQSEIDIKIDKTLKRIDHILELNQKYVWIAIIMSAAIFSLGIALIIIGILRDSTLIIAPSTIVNCFLYYPIRQIILIWRWSVKLAAAPIIVANYSEEVAAEILTDLLKKFGR